MRSRRLDVSSTETQDRTTGSLAAAISNLIVRLFAEYTGRGPNKARTTIRENVVVCVTQNSMTKGERRLVEGIETLTSRKVLSFMSDHDADHDYAAEIFVLDGAPGGALLPGDNDAS